MRPPIRLLLAVVLLAVTVVAQDPAGRWSGSVELPGQKLEIHVRLERQGEGWKGSIDIPAQGAKDLVLEKISVDGSEIGFAIAGVGGAPAFAGELAADGRTITGRFTQGGQDFPFALQSASEVSFDGIADFVDDLRTKFHVPGCAIAVVHGDEIVATFASGKRDVEHDLPVTPDTLFAIGSSTKAFTTLLLGTLVDEGRLDWDKPVRTWIPDFALSDAEAGERITPRDLVTHRSGMPRHDLTWYGANFDRADMVRRLRWLPLNHGLREEFQYNNLMLLTAGHLAERITGATWEQLVTQRIFEPLGMGRSNFVVETSAADGDHAEPYRHADARTEHIAFRNTTAIGPAGSINSSVREMAAWVSLHLGAGKRGDRTIVQESTMADLHRVRMPLPDRVGSPDLISVGYALGWFVDVYRGARRIHHGGNIDGFSALVAMLPDRDYGFVVLSNLDGTPLPEMLVRRLSDRVLGLPEKDWATEALAGIERAEAREVAAKKGESAERHEGTKPSHPLADYAGDYTHPGYGPCRIEVRGDALHVDFHGLGAPLEHWHYDVFRCAKDAANPEIEGTRIQFTTDFDGDIDALRVVLEPATDAIVFTREADAQLRDPEFLAKLCGEYELDGRTFTIALKGATLTLALPGQLHELEARRSLVFGVAKLTGYSVRFVLDAEGHAVAVRFRQPDGVFEAARKPGR
ncbi:MAG: serine hydrolase [Planctomycetota bacterium]